jgi:hypothetical protein
MVMPQPKRTLSVDRRRCLNATPSGDGKSDETAHPACQVVVVFPDVIDAFPLVGD